MELPHHVGNHSLCGTCSEKLVEQMPKLGCGMIG